MSSWGCESGMRMLNRGFLGWRSAEKGRRDAVVEILSPTGDLREAAATLFAKLRRLDEAGPVHLEGIASNQGERGLVAEFVVELIRECGIDLHGHDPRARRQEEPRQCPLPRSNLEDARPADIPERGDDSLGNAGVHEEVLPPARLPPMTASVAQEFRQVMLTSPPRETHHHAKPARHRSIRRARRS